MGPADPVARVAPEALGGPVAPVVRVDLAARSPVDPAGRVTLVDAGDMNRVVAATVGTAAVTDLASPAVPVGMILEVPVGPVGMILGDPGGRLPVPNPVVRVDPEGLGVQNPVRRGDLGNRETTDLSLGRALLGRMPIRRVRMPALLHLTAAGPVPMPALPHLTRADRRRDPTTRAVATCRGATRAEAILRAEATPAEAIRRAEATRKAELNRICPSRLAKAGAV